MRDDSAKLVLLAAAVAAFLAFAVIRPFAEWIGADFSTTLGSAVRSLLIMVPMLGLVAWIDTEFLPIATPGTLALGWFCWWPVLESIACNGCDPNGRFPSFMYDAFVNSLWVKLGVEFALIGLSAWAAVRHHRLYSW